MSAAGIDEKHRDDFVSHAANFDLDDNGYLKKAELEAAAEAWNENSSDEVAEDSSEEVEAPEEAPSAESSEEPVADEKACPICAVMNPQEATSCSVCSFTFV